MDRYQDIILGKQLITPGSSTTDDGVWCSLPGAGTLTKEQVSNAMVGVPTSLRRNRRTSTKHRKRSTYPGVGMGGTKGML